MPEYSREYSKEYAFRDDTYPEDDNPYSDDPEFGSKMIKVGNTTFWYDAEHETENSALPKKDIEKLIENKIEGFTGAIAMVSDITILDGVIKKKTRTFTYENGLLKNVSSESVWS